MCLTLPYCYKTFEHQNNYIMETKGPFVKIVLLNEVVK
jgi:hypothetical protein